MNKKMTCLIFISILILSTSVLVSSEKINKSYYEKIKSSEIKGNTLIVEKINKRVFEVDTNGELVWQKTGLDFLNDAERLNNGNTLIAEYGSDRVIEIDSSGSIVWELTGISGPQDVERFDNGNTWGCIDNTSSRCPDRLYWRKPLLYFAIYMFCGYWSICCI